MLRFFLIILLIICLCNNRSVAQNNIVPNPSFEDHKKCPLFLSEVPYTNKYDTFRTVRAWANPIENTTPDYYNRCASSSGNAGIPYNELGRQSPRTGDAYMGFMTYEGYSIAINPGFYAEYIYCKLTQPMIAGVTYDVTFYVSATYPAVSRSNAYFAVDRIGAHFSDTIAYRTGNEWTLEQDYHVRSTKGVPLVDTTGWMEISGQYIAKGGEAYMYIGNFRDNADTLMFKQIFPERPTPSQFYRSYYYVDDVSVRPNVICDTFITSSDSLICDRSGITLNSQKNSADSYIWSNGETGSSIRVAQSGKYWVAAMADTCDLYIDTFHVRKYIDTIRSNSQYTLCAEDSSQLILIASVPYAERYEWSTGETGVNSIIVSAQGNYTVRAYKDCELYHDEYEVREIIMEDFIALGNDTLLCEGRQYTLGEKLSEYIRYEWSTGDTTCCIQINLPGKYFVSITNGCNRKSDTIDIDYHECIDCISLPTAFTPNGDGLNDLYKAHFMCPVESYQIMIFNRWGEKVFASDNVAEGWDGNYKSKRADIGVYQYIIKYRDLFSEQVKMLKGDITLIR